MAPSVPAGARTLWDRPPVDKVTLWVTDRAREIVKCEGTALVASAEKLKIYEIEAESTLLTVAISQALPEAFFMGQEMARERA